MPTLTASDRAAHAADVDALVVFSRAVQHPVPSSAAAKDARTAQTAGAEPPSSHAALVEGGQVLPPAAQRHLLTVLATLHASGKAEEVVTVVAVPGVKAPVVTVVGLGDGTDEELLTAERVRAGVGAAVRHLTGRPRIGIVAPAADPVTVAALAEGSALAAYDFTRHRSTAPKPPSRPAEDVTVFGVKPRDRAIQSALTRAGVVGRHVAWARDLVNTSPNALYPASFAAAVTERAADLAAGVGASAKADVDVQIVEESDLADGGYGGITGVGQGSSHASCMVVMRYRPRRPAAHLAYVGKGITFDSGGLCIKPMNSMASMKCDMAGAAAVAATVLAAAELGVPVALTGVLALAENMPGGNAQRPGDVVTMGNGRTVEIINTDAEGRLVLADGLVMASRDEPDAMVDIATLTGAAVVALGKRTAAALANDDELLGEVTSAATVAGEAIWPLPIAQEIRPGMDSTVADLKHTGEAGAGGVMVGAAFLREFAGTDSDGGAIPWAHLDIAGPAFNEGSPYGYTPKGGTGYGVRTLLRLAEGRA